MKLAAEFLLFAALIGVGYGARGLWEAKPDRATAMVGLFETYCVPFLSGERIEPHTGLTVLKAGGWGDPASALRLETNETTCSVTDQLLYLNEDDRTQVAEQTDALMARALPDIPHDTERSMEGWDAFKVWARFPSFDERRSGVMLYRSADSGEGAVTVLRAFRPPNP